MSTAIINNQLQAVCTHARTVVNTVNPTVEPDDGEDVLICLDCGQDVPEAPVRAWTDEELAALDSEPLAW